MYNSVTLPPILWNRIIIILIWRKPDSQQMGRSDPESMSGYSSICALNNWIWGIWWKFLNLIMGMRKKMVRSFQKLDMKLGMV